MQNQMMMMLMSQLKAKNPQAFQMINQARQNQNNPMELFKEITSKNTPEQMKDFYDQIEKMGFPKEIIEQVKGINT